jgi:molecular chaperone GrpE
MPDEEFELEFEDEAHSSSVEKLRERLKKALKEKDEYLAGWQRAKADLINANKRAREEMARAGERAEEDLITDLLPTLDAFSMAMENKELWEKADEQWRKGVEYIYKELTKTLSERGLEEIPLKPGDALSHELHHVMKTVPTDDPGADDTIASVIQKGYLFKGSVLRPARVAAYQAEK